MIKSIRSYKSTCSYCGVGCGVIINKDKYNKLSIEGDPNHPVNKGMLCSKGRTLHHTVKDKSDRLLYPNMRWNRNLPLTQVDWDTAIERASAVFSSIIKKHGPDSVGFYVSGQLLTEEYYLVNKLTKGFIGTNNLDTNSRLCMSSAVVGYKMSLGEDSVPISYADIELADTFLITGANPAWCHPIIFRRLEQHKQANPNTKIIVVDPRKTQTCYLADIHLQITPGTDTILHHALGRIIIENDWIDRKFIEKHTEGYEVFAHKAFERTAAEAAIMCGINIEDLYLAAQYIGQSTAMISMWAMGLNQSANGVNKNLSLLNLHLITGNIGKPGAGPLSLTGQPNAMGGREVGGLSNLLSAHRNMNNPEHIQEVADYWGVPSVPNKPGLTATQMFEALKDGKMKAIWIICTNPIVSLPNANLVAEGLRNAKFVVVQDISTNSDTLEYADLVLPAAGYMEKEGTMTNSERRITHLPRVIESPGEALPDAEILIRFAKKMGYQKGFSYDKIEDVYLEHAGLTEGTNIDISGLDYSILKDKGSVQWPYPKGQGYGTTRLFTDKKFYTPSQKAQIFAVDDQISSEQTSSDFPLILTTGRIRDQWHTMTRTVKVNKLNKHIPSPFLEINPIDANYLGIYENSIVEVKSRRGIVRVSAKITDQIKQGVVFLPMHWGKKLGSQLSKANNLTNDLLDPQSKQPDYKYTAVSVQKYKKDKQTIAIIGAGAAAFQFMQSYRSLNAEDELVIFSKEETPFYNRVLLPDYINGVKTWEKLLKINDAEGVGLNIKVHKGKSITKIDREQKVILDQDGNRYAYDTLILATGSSSFRPPNLPNVEGIFSLRSKWDADAIRSYTQNKSHVVIVGGGLLGIELADSLNSLGLQVSIVQRASRLMERQLDQTASHLLAEELKDRNIHTLYNDEVRKVINNGKHITGLKLKSGRTIYCDAVVFAIGTRPNIGIAKEARIDCHRGVTVNQHLRTSDPHVFAIGEIAEFNNQLFGITAAAEEQANILARHLAGDPMANYQGSVLMNILKVEGLELCSIGMIEPQSNLDKAYEEIVVIDEKKRYYKKCLIHDDRLVGSILMGDKKEFLEFKEMISHKLELDEKRETLLRGSGEPKKVLGKLICSCNAVGQGNIEEAIKNGNTNLASVCESTGAGTGCGSCKPEVLQLLDHQIKLMDTQKIDSYAL